MVMLGGAKVTTGVRLTVTFNVVLFEQGTGSDAVSV